MRVVGLFAVALIAACATVSPSAHADAQDVVVAERAFAADAAQHGWAWAFRRHHAPDAIVLQPDPIQAEVTLASVEGDGGTNLDWRPAYAGISLSGDFGFTTGPFMFRGGDGRVVGHYFTVWRKQPDGVWKWVFDAGTDVVDTDPVAMDFVVPTLSVARSGVGTADVAVSQVAALEDAVVSGSPAVESLAARLSEDAHVNRVGSPRGIGRAASAALMRADGALTFRSLHREASDAGDMVFSMGEVRDQHEVAERLRYFARMWQHQAGGWRIVFDEIVPRRV